MKDIAASLTRNQLLELFGDRRFEKWRYVWWALLLIALLAGYFTGWRPV